MRAAVRGWTWLLEAKKRGGHPRAGRCRLAQLQAYIADIKLSHSSSFVLVVLSTTFSRPLSGLNLAGMLSHVVRPMRTAFCFPGGAAVVAAAKYFISLLSFHGRDPFRPIPRVESCATMRVAFNEEVEADEVDILSMRLSGNRVQLAEVERHHRHRRDRKGPTRRHCRLIGLVAYMSKVRYN